MDSDRGNRLSEKPLDGFDDLRLFRFGHFRKNGYRDNVSGGGFGDRTIPDTSAEFPEALLQVERLGIINFRTDAGCAQMIAQSVTSRCGDCVLMINVSAIRQTLRQSEVAESG